MYYLGNWDIILLFLVLYNLDAQIKDLFTYVWKKKLNSL